MIILARMESSKRQKVPGAPGVLFVGATPIGNLGDVTRRLRETIAEADWILCEDTRRTQELLSALSVAAPRLERFDAEVEHSRAMEKIVERVRSGERGLLLSDAGTPGISDPGARLVRALRERGMPVSPVPGPSALAAFVSVAGFKSNRFEFLGFYPRESRSRASLHARLEAEARLLAPEEGKAWVWFESPQRVGEAVQEWAVRFPSARAVVAKELTKRFEVFFAGSILDVARELKAHLVAEGERGEWVASLELEGTRTELSRDEESNWFKALECCLEAGAGVSASVKSVCQKFGVKKNETYEIALEIAKKTQKKS